MLKSKRGSVTLIFLAFFTLMFTLFGIYLNIRGSYEVYNRFETAVMETANYRSQAVDTYLKESFNIIEAFHDSSDYSRSHGQDINHEALSKDLPYGHVKIYSPSDEPYKQAYLNANAAAKNLFVDLMSKYIDSTKTNFNSNSKTYAVTPDNVCIDVVPLPLTGSVLNPTKATIEFSCDVTINGEKSTIKEKVTVSTINDPKLTKLVYNPNGILGDEDDVYSKVVNVVFVGAGIEHNNLLTGAFNAMQRFFYSDFDANKYNTAKKFTYAISYPQNDRCYGTHCSFY